MKQIINRIISWTLTAAMLLSLCTGQLYALDEPTAKLTGAIGTAVSGDTAQWNLSGDGAGIGVQSAWDKGLYGQGVRVALIDSGIYREHQDLQGVTIETGYNVMDGSTDTTDNYGHGTIIAGIIAADSRNALGMDGICDQVTLVPIKCFDASLTNVKHVIQGIYLAVDTYHCDVINLSLGVTSDLPALREAVDYAASKNVILVSAVGNSGETNPAQVLYPAAYDAVIGVGAYGPEGTVSPFSHVNSSVFVTAPGEELVSPGTDAPDAYRSVNGTSFAAAHVTALAAIARSADQNITPGQFRELLSQSARDAGDAGYDTAYGYGMITAAGLVAAMGALPAYADIGSHWARASIERCSDAGLLSGVGNGLFAPDAGVDRAMAVTTLWRMAGMPESGTGNVYDDISDTAWYAAAVAWATEVGITSGYGDGRFGPTDRVTREQLASMLCRYAAWQGLDTAAVIPTGFTDWDQVSPYARTSMAWAVAHRIIRGKTAETIVPGGTATRAELAVMLCNYLDAFTN